MDIKQGEDVRLVVHRVENPQTPQLSLGLHDLGEKSDTGLQQTE